MVLFTDLLDLKGTDNQLYKLSLAAHEYHHLKQKYYFDRFKQSNQVSAATVEKLQEQNQETIDALKELQQVIPNCGRMIKSYLLICLMHINSLVGLRMET